jgi:hypothetical protein
MTKDKEECVAGCNVFNGGEIRHHENCPFYPESLTEMYERKDRDNETLIKGISYLESISNDPIHPDLLGAFLRDLLDQVGIKKRSNKK